MKYVIDSKTYEKHIRDEVHLYGLLHQLAFLAGKVKDEKDHGKSGRDGKALRRDRGGKVRRLASSPAAIWCLGTGRTLPS